MRFAVFILLLFFFHMGDKSVSIFPAVSPLDTITVPIGGNTFSSRHLLDDSTINNEGIVNWTDAQDVFTTYVRVTQRGTLKVWVPLQVPQGNSRIAVAIQGITKTISASTPALQSYYAGEWTITDTGYIPIVLKGLSKTGDQFAHITDLLLSGTTINDNTAYVKNNEGQFYYWGRRGPSVHLNYTLPEGVAAEWFYNEITVPEGQDVEGSYFMADGFAEGYFGIQVNSPTERRILFSVWSPYRTDDPAQIPDSQKIQLLKKGEGVHAGEFGNEGSGGQSYLRYAWKTGTTYRFLLHGQRDGPGHTIYTAYFYPPEGGRWLLIASFRRPKTHTYLTRLHSFLENFIPEQGDKSRKALFTNQWIRSDKGQWIELDKALFTGDNTAVKGYRMDYSGGVEGQAFFLKNGGFFSQYTPLRSPLTRALSGRQPAIELDSLP